MSDPNEPGGGAWGGSDFDYVTAEEAGEMAEFEKRLQSEALEQWMRDANWGGFGLE